MSDIETDSGALDTDIVEVRSLQTGDLDWVARIDEAHTGRNRRDYLRVKLVEAERDTGMRISLAARIEDIPAGFLLGRLYFGEFGVPEPVAVLDTVGVAMDFAGRKVAKALMRQMLMQLRALRIEKVETEVGWEETELMSFLRAAGFRPAPRLCLDLPVADAAWLD